MLNRLTREAPAASPIAMRDILRTLTLLGVVQVGAFLLFIVYSTVIFRLWEGGIFFYKSFVTAALFSVLLFSGLLWVAAIPVINHWLSSASLHRLWFAILSAVAQFCIIVAFNGDIPVAIDRSVSVYLLGIMENEPQHAFTKAELENRLIRDYVQNYGAVERRLAEQVASRDVELDKDGYRLTAQGAVVVHAMKTVAWIFNLDRRFVDPMEAQPAPGKGDRSRSAVR